MLKEKGYVRTAPGPFGGYMLARPAAEISVQGVLRAFEDELRLGGAYAPRTARFAVSGSLADLMPQGGAADANA